MRKERKGLVARKRSHFVMVLRVLASFVLFWVHVLCGKRPAKSPLVACPRHCLSVAAI